MAVVLLTIDHDLVMQASSLPLSQEARPKTSAIKRAVRITDEPTYRDHFLPMCVSLGLPLMSSALNGILITPSDIHSLRDEFRRLKEHVSGVWFPNPRWLGKHIPWACEQAINALDAFTAAPSGDLYLVSSYAPQQATGLPPFDHDTLLPLGEPADVRPHVQALFSLTKVTDWQDAIDRCRSMGWTLDESYREPGSAWFQLDEHLRLYVDTGAGSGRNAFAFVVLHLFHELGPEMADFYPPGRSDYDRAYALAESQVKSVLGNPATQGEYRHAFRPDWPYHYAVWPGQAGTLMLRQDELDIQSGMDLNLWVQPWNPSDPLPTPPIPFG